MFTVENLKDMVYQINHCTGVVGPEECLSDSIYYYNEDMDTVVLVSQRAEGKGWQDTGGWNKACWEPKGFLERLALDSICVWNDDREPC